LNKVDVDKLDVKCSYAFFDQGQSKLFCAILYLQDKRTIVTNGLQNFHKKFVIILYQHLKSSSLRTLMKEQNNLKTYVHAQLPLSQQIFTSPHLVVTMSFIFQSFNKLL